MIFLTLFLLSLALCPHPLTPVSLPPLIKHTNVPKHPSRSRLSCGTLFFHGEKRKRAAS